MAQHLRPGALPMLLATLLSALLAPQRLRADVALRASLPPLTVAALDGHTVSLPRDLSQRTVLIVGFSRASAKNTAAWDIPVRTRLAAAGIGAYDLAVAGGVPTLLRGSITHAMRREVPMILQPHFLAVYLGADAWKAVCGYDAAAPDAAYVVVTDAAGHVLSRTHEPYSPAAFARLTHDVETP